MPMLINMAEGRERLGRLVVRPDALLLPVHPCSSSLEGLGHVLCCILTLGNLSGTFFFLNLFSTLFRRNLFGLENHFAPITTSSSFLRLPSFCLSLLLD